MPVLLINDQEWLYFKLIIFLSVERTSVQRHKIEIKEQHWVLMPYQISSDACIPKVKIAPDQLVALQVFNVSAMWSPLKKR